MAFWEFLIQKEGDRSWLPLESSKVEVLEGRYRIVAHASQPNMSLEIRITHDATAEMPPIRRTQKRFSRTNKNGLVVILPFTRLLPGIWDLRCTSDLMAEMLGEGWQHTVRLQVLPLEIEISDEWEADWRAGLTNAEGVHPEGGIAESRAESRIDSPSPQQEKITQEPVAPGNVAAEQIVPENHSSDLMPLPEESTRVGSASDLLPLAAHSATPLPPAPSSLSSVQSTGLDSPAQPAIDPSDEALAPPAINSETAVTSVRLQLEQDTYVIETGQPLVLMGQVEAEDGQPLDRPVPLEYLQVRLYDPRNSQILVEERQPLTARTLPFTFTCRITLPDHFQTYLVLGEITLHSPPTGGSSSVLVTQPFSVTTDLHELLEAIANDFSEADVLLPGDTASDAAALELLNIPVEPIQFRPSPPHPLPPQLRPADPRKTWQSLDLPSFHEPGTNSVHELAWQETETPDASEPTATQPEPGTEHPLEPTASLTESEGLRSSGWSSESTESITPQFSTPQSGTPQSGTPQFGTSQWTEPLLSPPASVPQAFDDDAPIPDWDRDELRSPQQQSPSPLPPASQSDAPEDIAFRALNLQERFWTRLQALVADQELTEWLSTFEDSWDNMNRARRRPSWQDAILTEREVVAEDELPAAPDTDNASGFTDAQAGVPVLSIQQPIPIPQLEVSTGELTAGQALPIRVKLPDLSHPLFVKLWLVDRQNRSVLDGPYWLTDFTPSGFGDLVSHYELTIPQGCLELQLEAITIEMTTQRESEKATLTRQVIPPNLSDLALDELDV